MAVRIAHYHNIIDVLIKHHIKNGNFTAKHSICEEEVSLVIDKKRDTLNEILTNKLVCRFIPISSSPINESVNEMFIFSTKHTVLKSNYYWWSFGMKHKQSISDLSSHVWIKYH